MNDDLKNKYFKSNHPLFLQPVIPRVESVSGFFTRWTREMKSWARKMKSKMLQKMRKPRKGFVKAESRKAWFGAKSQYPIPA